MCAQRQGKFPTVVKIVFDNVPDDPMARKHFIASREGLLQVWNCPACKPIWIIHQVISWSLCLPYDRRPENARNFPR